MPTKVIFVAGSIGQLKKVAVSIIEIYRARGVPAINVPFGTDRDINDYENFTLEQCLSETTQIINSVDTQIVILHGWKPGKFINELTAQYSTNTWVFMKVFRKKEDGVPKNYLTHVGRERLLEITGQLEETLENFYSSANLNFNWKPRSQSNTFNDDWSINDTNTSGRQFVIVRGDFTL
jgi:hypothetical protein